MKRVIYFLLCMLICLCSEGSPVPHCSVFFTNTRLSETKFVSNIKIDAPNEWKFAKEPKISLPNGNFEAHSTKKDDATCEVVIVAEIKADGIYPIKIDSFLCKDICTVVSDTIQLRFDPKQEITPENNIQNSTQSPANDLSMLHILVLAFIGGLILNVMPCVLPVLLLKLRAFSRNKAAMLGTISGIYVTFFVYTSIVIALKICGESVGWGMHFQNVHFLKFATIMAFLLMLYSLEILQLNPSIELRDNRKSEFLKNFFSGIVASIMAMPCTAPFLGTATLYAMRGTAAEVALIFSAIALGFSAPYIAAIFIPEIQIPRGISRFAPIFKRIVDFGVIVAFLWMLFLLANHCRAEVFAVYVAIFAISAALVRKSVKIALLAMVSIFLINAEPATSGDTRRKDTWIVSENIDAISEMTQEALSEGRIVILSISADWCLTCKYNEINLFGSQELRDIIKRRNILCIEGDMSRPNESMMNFVQKHNRAGIPFMMIYGPNAQNGIVMPEIPTIKDIEDTVKRVN